MATKYFTLICDQAPTTVVLTDPGPRPFETVQVIRRLTGLSLWHGKSLLGSLPATVLDEVSPAVAAAAVSALLEAGAQAESR